MRIRSRLSLAFLVMILVTLGVGVLGLLRMREMSQAIHAIAVDRFGKVRLAESAVTKINDNSRLALHLFLVADPAEFEQQVGEQLQTSREITDLYATFSRSIDSEEERRLFEDVLHARSTYTSDRTSAEALLRGGDAKRAREQMEREVLPELDAYIQAWDALLALEGQRMEAAAREAAASYERARAVTVALILLAAAAAAIFAALTVRRVTRPILAVTRAAERLESGEVDAKVDLRSIGADEVGVLARAFNSMSDAVAFRQERLKREMSLAQEIQTALLPRDPRSASLDLSAAMRPATEVGGDYYDVLPVPGGCWIGMGDVAGHGLDAGLIMLMIQASVAALVRDDPGIAPRVAITAVNRVLYENLGRLGKASHATMVLLRCHDDGDVVFAGAHEEVIVYRATTGQSEIVNTKGAWVGGMADIEAATSDSSLHLDVGDVLVLFTDGVTEARNEAGIMFGVERLCAELESAGKEPVERIRDRVLAASTAWAARVEDDMSVVVARRNAVRA
jgi:serine phosphatase RsbU (regulator of sigma subunit)